MRHLNTDWRQVLVKGLRQQLGAAAPGSEVAPRGSLATGTADQYSDIDLLWEIPDDRFTSCVSQIDVILAGVAPITLLRSDPDFQNSDRRRLFFVWFDGYPLFWQLDLEIFARSVHRDPAYDLLNPHARGSTWSAAASALANAVAAIKACLRQRPDTAKELLERAFLRLGSAPLDGDISMLVRRLAHLAGQADPACRGLATRVLALADDFLGQNLNLTSAKARHE
jgi:hypothetical protein